MQPRFLRSIQYFCLPCLVLCLALTAPARNTHNFGGDYRILQVTEQGDNVELRISLRVINFSGADVQDATISLTSSAKPTVGCQPRRSRALDASPMRLATSVGRK